MAQNEKENSSLIVLLRWLLGVALAVVIFYLFYQFNILKTQVNNLEQEPSITSVSYNCDNNKTIQAQFFDNKAELELNNGRSMLLMQGVSASGVRYTNSDESFVFWTKGNTAFIEEGSENTVTYNNCTETTSN